MRRNLKYISLFVPPGFYAAFMLATMSFIPGLCVADQPATLPGSQNPPPPVIFQVPVPSDADNRYGLFNGLDHRSLYGKGVYPEPLLVDDSDGEIHELRLDWFHQNGKGFNGNMTLGEFEVGNGIWTFELAGAYEYDTQTMPGLGGVRVQGLDNLAPGFRTALYEYVTPDEQFDTAFGAGIEIGIPLNSPLSKNPEIVPKIFNDTRIGEHFTSQIILGWSWLRGSTASGGGEQHFEYGVVLGWTIAHHELPMPGVQDFIPVLELNGATLMNTHSGGQDNLVADFAFRANLYAIGRAQPRLGVGYVVPLDSTAREQFRWGIYSSIVLEF